VALQPIRCDNALGSISRRAALKLTALTVAAPLMASARPRKRVIVAGAGIGGLCCAWELVRRGHDVVIVEASGRTGGHVLTYREGLPDGLYVDAGAEHFTRPGYERYWSYVREFELPFLYYPRRENLIRWINGRPYSADMLADRRVLAELGFNQRELAFLAEHPYPELRSLYFAPYVDDFRDEYRPFEAGLDRLDAMTETDLLRQEGASLIAQQLHGGSSSALQAVWHAAILEMRGVPLFPPELYRLRGGNQTLTDAFASRLGERIRLDSPVTEIELGASGVRVGLRREQLEADYLVCAMSAAMLSRIPVKPAWSAEKAHALNNVPYYSDTRVILQSRTRFWARDRRSPNMEFGDPALNHVWSTGDDVSTTRGLLVGTASGPGAPDPALRVFRRQYPGRSEDIERVQVVAWPTDPWSWACERTEYPPGQLRKMWPALIEPHGRVHFVGAYADNLNWGMEAATRSAYRAAEAIDAA
jgi:monoamine oxidase